MTRWTLPLGGVLLLLWGCASTVPLTTPLPQPVAVSRYYLTIEGIDLREIAPEDLYAGGLLPALVEGYLQRENIKEAIETLRKGRQSPLRKQMDSLFTWLQTTLAHTYGIHLLPLDSVRDVQRDWLFDLPIEGARHFLKHAPYPAAMELTANIDFSLGSYQALDLILTGKETYKTHPVVTLNLLVVDRSGKIYWREHYRYTSKQLFTIDRQFILGIPVRQETATPASIYTLLREALEAMLSHSQKHSYL